MIEPEHVLEFKQVSKDFGHLNVLKNLSFSLQQGRIYSLIGESGCGKTTALRLMNGLEHPSSGKVFLNGSPFAYKNAVSERRKMGYCLQGYTLFPHLTVFENMSIIAKKSGWTSKQIEHRALEVTELMGLPANQVFSKYPNQLSGGQQQRIGIARAIFMKPEVLLMDEPFGALDPITRNEIQDAFIQLQKKLNLTVVLVTHDLGEAFKMSHEILLLENGRLVQRGRPNKLLMHPATEYVANFLKTNSPGHILKEIPLYTAMSSDVYWVYESAGKTGVRNPEEELTCWFESRSDLESYKTSSPGVYFETDDKGVLLDKAQLTLASKSSLLDALKSLMKTKQTYLPVVNDHQQVVGFFGEGALDALS